MVLRCYKVKKSLYLCGFWKNLRCYTAVLQGVTVLHFFLRYAQKHIKKLVKMTCDCEFCDCERVIINYRKSKGVRT